MRQETDRLREPAAWALVGFLAVRCGVDALRVLFGVGSGVDGFRARAYGGQGALLNELTPVLLAVAVVLVTHLGRPTPRAGAVTRTAFGVLAVQGVTGLVVALGALAYGGGGFDIPAAARVEQTAVNAGVLVLFALCAFFLILVLRAPSPPTVTRGKSLPHHEWPSYAPDPQAHPAPGHAPPSGAHRVDGVAPPPGRPEQASPSGQYAAARGDRAAQPEPAPAAGQYATQAGQGRTGPVEQASPTGQYAAPATVSGAHPAAPAVSAPPRPTAPPPPSPQHDHGRPRP